MTDLTKTVAPKTDQLNADDLLGGKTKTITITGVRGYDAKDQPIGINYDGDNGKPWKPCLGMRRVLIELWGEDAAKEADKHYRGRQVTLYRDPDITFGKAVMGGIRISHASHIKAEKKVVLTVAKARRVEFIVKPLVISKTETPPSATTQTDKQSSNPELEKKARAIKNAITLEETTDGLQAIFDTDFKDDLEFIKKENGKTYQYLVDLAEQRRVQLSASPSGDLPSLMGG